MSIFLSKTKISIGAMDAPRANHRQIIRPYLCLVGISLGAISGSTLDLSQGVRRRPFYSESPKSGPGMTVPKRSRSVSSLNDRYRDRGGVAPAVEARYRIWRWLFRLLLPLAASLSG